MKFWDSSAIVPLLLREEHSETVASILAADARMMVWTLSPLECLSALFRRERDNPLPLRMSGLFVERLRALEAAWIEVQQVAWTKLRAARLLAHYPLKAADACQLAAALVGCEERPHELEFVTLDAQLARAASREGLRVLGV